MEALILAISIGFVIYRWGKQFAEFVKQEQQKSKQKSQGAHRVIAIHSDDDANDLTTIPIRQQGSKSSSEKLFKEDTWRRQLFLSAVVVGLGYLLYLILI